MHSDQPRVFIGLMSGTSCDGVDAAAVRVRGAGLDMSASFVGHLHRLYPSDLRRRLLSVMAPAETRTEDVARLHFAVGRIFADCAVDLMRQCGLGAGDVCAIGSHGQTICHVPHDADTPATLQIGEPALIAARTGAVVVADFRPADIAVGGQGAPLVPWTDYVLFRHPQRSRCIQNIGGIANVTSIPAGAAPGDVIAFDTGPGCMVIDEIVRREFGPELQYDAGGAMAAAGVPNAVVVDRILDLPFFAQPPPKCAGREQFGRGFVDRLCRDLSGERVTARDRVATATLLTARSIALAYRRFLPPSWRDGDVVLCGGGARNPTLVEMLRREFDGCRIKSTDDFGVPAQAKECVSFALLAAACIDGVPANLPQVTGASRPAILGKLVRV